MHSTGKKVDVVNSLIYVCWYWTCSVDYLAGKLASPTFEFYQGKYTENIDYTQLLDFLDQPIMEEFHTVVIFFLVCLRRVT